MAEYFKRKGIKAPGRVNVKLAGRFSEVCLDHLQDSQLKELYESGFPYVEPTEEGRKKFYPEAKEISIKVVSSAGNIENAASSETKKEHKEDKKIKNYRK